ALQAEPRAAVGRLLLGGGVAAAVFAAAFAPVLVQHSEAWRQFLAHVRHYGQGFLGDAGHTWRYGRWTLLTAAGLTAAGAALPGWPGRLLGRPLAWWWLPPAAALVFVFLASPSRHPYLWFPCPVLLALAARACEQLAAEQRW